MDERTGWENEGTSKRSARSDDGPDAWDEVADGSRDYDPSHYVETYEEPFDHAYDPYDQGPYGRAYESEAYHFRPSVGYSAHPPPYAYPQPYPMMQKPTNPTNPKIGGALIIVSGCLSLLWILVIYSAENVTGFFFIDELMVCIVIQLIFSIIAILGGTMAVMRRAYWLALTGAVLAMLSFGFFIISFILGLIGLILIATSRNAFIDFRPPQMPIPPAPPPMYPPR
jgi:hypothetical protein